MRNRLAPLLTWVLLGASLIVVVSYQVSRPVAAAGDPRVFVPSPRFYERLPESWRTTVSDAYWLYLIQYYGEHIRGDYRFDSLPELLDLVTGLSPRWEKPYVFGAYALLDMDNGGGRPDLSYDLMNRGYEENPRDWRLAFNLGIFAYWFGNELPQLEGQDNDSVAARWLEIAAGLPGRPDYVPRLAAALIAKGDDRGKAIQVWAQVYANGDEYSRQKAVTALDALLPKEPARRWAELDKVRWSMSPERYVALVRDLGGGS